MAAAKLPPGAGATTRAPGGAFATGAVETPLGTLTVVASAAGLRALLWPGEPAPPGSDAGAGGLVEEARRQLEEYFAGRRRRFALPMELAGSPFQRRCWLALAGIPFAATRSYGEQARRLGAPRAARAVGAANARNPLPILLPCHRLVGASGALTGFGGGLEAKAALIAHERRVAGS